MAATDISIDQLQANWRDFLPEDADLPSADTTLSVSEDDWRERLDADAFDVAVQGRHRTRWLQSARQRKTRRHLRLSRLRITAVHLGDEIRQRYRLAKLLYQHPRPFGHIEGLQDDSSTNGISLRALWRPSGSCIHGRSAADQPALVQQRRGADFPAETRLSAGQYAREINRFSDGPQQLRIPVKVASHSGV